MKSLFFKTIFGALVLVALTACGGGGDGDEPAAVVPPPASDGTVITKDNYVDVAGLSIVAAMRIEFVIDLVDQTFQSVIDTGDVPGTYPCLFGGTLSYTRFGPDYTFTAASCDTFIAGERVIIQSGSMQVRNPVVQATSSGYFLTSAAITFGNSNVIEKGAPTVYSGNVNVASTVTSSTTANVRGTGNLSVQRNGRTDSYGNVDVSLVATLSFGNLVRSGSLTLSSPRAPGTLTMTASTALATDSIVSAASDGSQSILATSNGLDFDLQHAVGGTVRTVSTGNYYTGPLADAIARALQ